MPGGQGVQDRPLRVLGIDPGTLFAGYGVVEGRNGALGLVAAGQITAPRREALPGRLMLLFQQFSELLITYTPDVVAVENTFVANNARTAMVLGQARAVALLVAALGAKPVYEYNPTQVKMAMTGYGAATKEQVQAMVGRLLRLASPPKSQHASDALAVAICHLHTAPERMASR